jgi:glycerophosphoryl diester phosphodiesterase
VKSSLIVFLSLVLGWNLLIFYIDKQQEEKQQEEIYSQCDKVWVSRGLYQDFAKRNTIQSMKKAFDSGSNGVEIDFYYDIDMNRFVVSHNKPKKDKSGQFIYEKKDNNKILTIEKLLRTFDGNNKFYWFDYKNLDRLSFEDTKKAIKRLLSITDENLRNHIYIEGSNPIKVSLYTDAGFKTLLGLRPLGDNNIFASLATDAFKIIYYFFNISALAIEYGDDKIPYYGVKADEGFKNIPIFLFHLPYKRKLLEEIVSKKNIKVVLPISIPYQFREEDISNINMCK